MCSIANAGINDVVGLADVDEPLPPTETVLSGIEGDFQPGKGESQEKEKGGEGDKDEGGDGEESEEGGELKDEEQGSEEAEEEEPEEDPPVVEVKTAAHDPRFPSTNQVHHCCQSACTDYGILNMMLCCCKLLLSGREDAFWWFSNDLTMAVLLVQARHCYTRYVSIFLSSFTSRATLCCKFFCTC